MRLTVLSLLCYSVCVAAPARAQAPLLTVVPGPRVELSKTGGARDYSLVPGPRGQALIFPRSGYGTLMELYDSAGKRLWNIQMGRNDNSDIMFASRGGWISGTPTVWIADPGFRQTALLDAAGKVTKSVEDASWIHPHWAERRKFPVFASMEVVAVYPDETMLILPGRERSLISTPGYDHSTQHLLRVTKSGAIERTVATLPFDAGRIDFRGRRGSGTIIGPFSGRAMWAASSDGLRIGIVTPGVSLADSGTIRFTMLNERGDTLFARRYPAVAKRIDPAAVDTFMAHIRPLGEMSAEHIRDSLRKGVAVFESPLTGVAVGSGGTSMIVTKSLTDTSNVRYVMVIDEHGTLIGTVTMPPDVVPAAIAGDQLWGFEMGRMKTATAAIRYSLRPTGAPPSRTVKAGASTKPSRPPT